MENSKESKEGLLSRLHLLQQKYAQYEEILLIMDQKYIPNEIVNTLISATTKPTLDTNEKENSYIKINLFF